jgi:hypothetical protein
MLTLADLKEYYKNRQIDLMINFRPDPVEEFFYIFCVALDDRQITDVLTNRKLTIERSGLTKKFNTDREGSLSVYITRRIIKDYQWEIIKKKMKETGFVYRSKSYWFQVYQKGGWKLPQ